MRPLSFATQEICKALVVVMLAATLVTLAPVGGTLVDPSAPAQLALA